MLIHKLNKIEKEIIDEEDDVNEENEKDEVDEEELEKVLSKKTPSCLVKLFK